MRRMLWVSCLAGAALWGTTLWGGGGSAGETQTVWSRAHEPAQGPALSVGTYASGCLQGAEELSAESPLYRIMRPERHRTFGHPRLIEFITQLSAHLAEHKLAPLAVGDLGQARGGPAPNGHASHQNGLDVDLWFAPAAPGAEDYSVVDGAKQKPNEHWSDRVPQLLERAASEPHVARIFVNAVIKRELCQHATGDRTWLGKLRPWWGHDDHFHVRLECPEDSPLCQSQPPLPPGDGCEEVDWWLNAQSAKDRDKGVGTYQKRVGAQPKLPEFCQKLAVAPANLGKTAARSQ
jgi:penicillin-insensitive murein endopeptidase